MTVVETDPTVKTITIKKEMTGAVGGTTERVLVSATCVVRRSRRSLANALRL